MIHPSSSEEELNVEVISVSENIAACVELKNVLPSSNVTDSSSSFPESSHSSARLSSPTISVTSEEIDAKTRCAQEEEEHRMKLQLYVFVARCIAYPFAAEQPTNLPKKPFKITKNALAKLLEMVSKSLSENSCKSYEDNAFKIALTAYYEEFLKSVRLERLVLGGGCSLLDLKNIFKYYVNYLIKTNAKDEKSLKQFEIIEESLSRRFDVFFEFLEEAKRRYNKHNPTEFEPASSKEGLYSMFRSILGIKMFEHQLIFNACQLDNADEQAAAVRRELKGRLIATDKIEANNRFPKFKCDPERVDDVNQLYIDELREQVYALTRALEKVPVAAKSASGKSTAARQKFRKHLSSTPTLSIDRSTEEESFISKSDVILQFGIEVLVMEIEGINSIPPNKMIYCTMEVGGSGEKLQTDLVPASNAVWDTRGDFTTNNPLASVKVKLCLKSHVVLPLEDKELGKTSIICSSNHPKTPQWYNMIVPKGSNDQLRVKLKITMERPLNMKQCGYLWAQGLSVWKKWKKRFFILVQVSQCNFAMCSYLERKTEPTEMVPIDGYTVGYTLPDNHCKQGSIFFKTVKEGDSIAFASENEQEGIMWVLAIYRATGQTDKPVPPSQVKKDARPGENSVRTTTYDGRLKKEDIDRMTLADPCKYDHASLLEQLQSLTLSYRLNEPGVSLGSFSPGQMLVLDEYCARYGVRDCHRRLCHLSSVLEQLQRGFYINPKVMHESHNISSSYFNNYNSNLPTETSTVTVDESDRFELLREELSTYFKRQVTLFQLVFPFGLPTKSFKSTLDFWSFFLNEKPRDENEVIDLRSAVSSCLRDSAVVYFKRLVDHYKLKQSDQNHSQLSVEDFVLLSSESVNTLRQNQDLLCAPHYNWFPAEYEIYATCYVEYLFAELEKLLAKVSQSCFECFKIYRILNNYLKKQNHEKWRTRLSGLFFPLANSYVQSTQRLLADYSMRQSVVEQWDTSARIAQSRKVAIGLVNRAICTIKFLSDLSWADDTFIRISLKDLRSAHLKILQRQISSLGLRCDVIMKTFWVGLDYVIPKEVCALLNVIIELRESSMELYMPGFDVVGMRYCYRDQVKEIANKHIQKTTELILYKFEKALDSVLVKLARYDDGTLSATLLKLTKPSLELAKDYDDFVSANQEVIRDSIKDDLFIQSLFSKWYAAGMAQIKKWLDERPHNGSLHFQQTKSLVYIFIKFYKQFELEAVKGIQNETYKEILMRLKVEETAHSISAGFTGELTMESFQPLEDEEKTPKTKDSSPDSERPGSLPVKKVYE